MYSIISTPNKLMDDDMKSHLATMEKKTPMSDKRALKNYFLGIYLCLEEKIKHLVHQNKSLLEENAIALIWFLYRFYRAMKEYSTPNVHTNIEDISLATDITLNVSNFILHVRGILEQALQFGLNMDVLQTKVKNCLKCTSS